jgi:hypothetical protein
MKKPMKLAALCLSVAFVCTAVWQTIPYLADPPIRQFSVEQLTSQQLAACSDFKALTNQPRHSQLARVQKLGILPHAPFIIQEDSVLHTARIRLHAAFTWWFGSATTKIDPKYGRPTFMMTRQDVTNLLGEPSSSNTNSLQYHVGFLDGSYHIFMVRLHRDHVVGTGGMEIR